MNNKAVKVDVCYVYKWTHLPSFSWYVGVRYAKGCHPEDGYLCSSKSVKPRIIRHPTEWVRSIIAIGSKQEMILLEAEILELMFDSKDPRCLNRHGVGGYPERKKGTSPETRRKIGDALRGRKRSPEQVAYLKAVLARIPRPMLGKKHSDETKRKMREAYKEVTLPIIKAKVVSPKSRAKMRDARLGKITPIEVKEKLRQRALSRASTACPHCGKVGPIPQLKRWHFDNCKNK